MTMSAGVTTSQQAAVAAGSVGPSAAARMICSQEVRHDIAHAAGVPSVSPGTATWANRLYTCSYQLSAGSLVLSVQDSASLTAGHRYFSAAQRRANAARPFRGLLGLGLPSYQTRDGAVAFLKDGKTLTVDASGLSGLAAPGRRMQADLAYAVAADVVACWRE
jgi:hypothetical protein